MSAMGTLIGAGEENAARPDSTLNGDRRAREERRREAMAGDKGSGDEAQRCGMGEPERRSSFGELGRFPAADTPPQPRAYALPASVLFYHRRSFVSA